jgi:hypothetical protein
MRRARAIALLLAALTAALAASAAPAAALYNPVAGGTARLTLARPFLRALRAGGVELSAGAGASLHDATVTFPLAEGRLDPVGVRGSAIGAGTLVFRAGRRKLPLKALQLKTTQARSPLSAKLGGGKLKLGTARLATERSGFGLLAKVSAVRLSAKLAERLDKKLGLGRALGAGQLLGSARFLALPETVAILPTGAASLELSADFEAKLASLFVAVNPIFPAERPGAFTLPVAGGKLSPDGSSGYLVTEGALELIQVGAGQLFWRGLSLDLSSGLADAEAELDPAPPYPGRLGEQAILGVGGGVASSEPAARAISLVGATLTLQAPTARYLNEAFAEPQGRSDVFTAGEALGTVSFAVTAE